MSEAAADAAGNQQVNPIEAAAGATDAADQSTLDHLSSLGELSRAWLADVLPANLSADWMILLIHLGGIGLACLLTFLIARLVVIPPVSKVIRRSSFEWDDIFLHAEVFSRVSNFVAAFVAYVASAALLAPWPLIELVLLRVALATTIVFGLLTATAVLNAANALYMRRPNAHNRPIKGYLSLVKIILSVIGAIVVLGILIDKSPVLLLTGLGAMTAVLLLIFKDTILSVVAAVTIGANDMIRIGDWITVPTAGADGDVIDIALHHVTVQNFDKTIVTIPSYKLVADSFTNWRGMSRSGGRRIKRSFNIDVSSIGFLDDEQTERFGKFVLLEGYIAEKREVLRAYNAEHEPGGLTANARRLTNIGTLRAYVINYLRSLDTIHQEGMTFLVRQLQPTEHGLPIEIYVFATTTNWVEYEGIQADIFDHVLAIVPEFGLRVYQSPSGADVERGLAAAASKG